MEKIRVLTSKERYFSLLESGRFETKASLAVIDNDFYHFSAIVEGCSLKDALTVFDKEFSKVADIVHCWVGSIMQVMSICGYKGEETYLCVKNYLSFIAEPLCSGKYRITITVSE